NYCTPDILLLQPGPLNFIVDRHSRVSACRATVAALETSSVYIRIPITSRMACRVGTSLVNKIDKIVDICDTSAIASGGRHGRRSVGHPPRRAQHVDAHLAALGPVVRQAGHRIHPSQPDRGLV